MKNSRGGAKPPEIEFGSTADSVNHPSPGHWLKPRDAAHHAGVCVRTIGRWLNSGLRHVRVGRVVRIHQADLDNFLRQI